jgi:hypothetical protein
LLSGLVVLKGTLKKRVKNAKSSNDETISMLTTSNGSINQATIQNATQRVSATNRIE